MAEGKLAIDPELIRELAALLDENSLSEIEVEQHGTRIRVARRAPENSKGPAPPLAPPWPPARLDPRPRPAATVVDPAPHPGMVASPRVGTAYRASEPAGKPFVDIGTAVKAGDTLLIIEAMK